MKLQTVHVGLAAAAGCVILAATNRLLDNLVQGNPLLGGPSPDWTHRDRELVLVTGGSSGIGRAIVDALVAQGVRVAVFDLARPAAGFPSPVLFYQVDVCDDAAIHAAADRLRADAGDPSVLVNNAGIGHGLTLLEATNEQMRRVFAVNAVAPIVLLREFLPAMVRADHGHVVTMASMASFGPIAGNVDYSATKAALLAVHEGLRQELKHRYHAPNVKTSIIHPFWVRSPLSGMLVARGSLHEPIMEPTVVANAVADLVTTGRSGTVLLPWFMRGAVLTRTLPVWMQELIRDFRAGVMQH